MYENLEFDFFAAFLESSFQEDQFLILPMGFSDL